LASLKLFGGAYIETLAGPLTGRATQRRRLALLALLAVSRGMSREKLIAYLWPDQDVERSRHLLSDSVYRINKALGEDTVFAVGDELRLSPQSLQSDVAGFEEALDQGRYDGAIGLYRGPFLDGFFLSDAPEFERWAERERNRLARLYATALESLAEEREREGEFLRATEWWYKVAAHDPLSRRIAMRLMKALDAAGERAAALQHAKVYETLFQQEFGAEVDPEVTALAEHLRSEPVGEAAHASEVEQRNVEVAYRVTGMAYPFAGEPESLDATRAAPPHAGPFSPSASASPVPSIPHAEAVQEAEGGAAMAGMRTPDFARRRKRLALVLGVAAGLLVLFGLFWQRSHAPAAPSASSPPSRCSPLQI
jgi:DNA-binding SARP family transcriptional activator